jgi:predicted glycogen debranching enzyme
MRNLAVHKMHWSGSDAAPELLLEREWLVTNGLGGYASGTLSGATTRRYHGLLVAALPAPHGRTVMLNHLHEEVRLPDGTMVPVGSEERADGTLLLDAACTLAEFYLDMGLPVWRYEVSGVTLEKRVLLCHQQNTAHITYDVLEARGPVRLRVRPSMHFRPHETPVNQAAEGDYTLTCAGLRHEVRGPGGHVLRLAVHGPAAWVLDAGGYRDIFYRVERRRGYPSEGCLYSPGYVRADLAAGQSLALTASTESWDTLLALTPAEAREAELLRRQRLLAQAHPKARQGCAADLVLAADSFLIAPVSRTVDAARAHAAGDEVRSVIAGYHWFTDWGRDTMISFEGLACVTGRHVEAGWILRTFGHYVRDGLLPNLFPEGENEGLYHTADATLWYFHALDRYLNATGDHATLKLLLPTLRDIVAKHVEGTRFGIHVDPVDGLLVQSAPGYQLTWMDAKCDGWVVTPRRGKAVEINALWFNALKLLAGWLAQSGQAHAAVDLESRARQTQGAFNRRFWNAELCCLYDVVDGEDGDDSAVRPNQIFSLSLTNPVLDPKHWKSVLHTVEEELLTPVGLRTLQRSHKDYKPYYDGDLRARDAAYHQGTVWSWLIGPWVDAWLRVYPDDRAGARRFLHGLTEHLTEACIGSVSEVFDAAAPYAPRGCIAQAWGVAELLRAYLKTEA